MKTIPLLLWSLLLAVPVYAQTSDASQITVIGEGVIKATPDQAWVSIGVESRSKVSKDAQQRNADVMSAVMQKIMSFGIPKDAIKTTAIDLQLEFDYANGKQTTRGYVARNTVEVRVDELTKLGDVLDAAVASGATAIHGVRFDVKERDKSEASALQAAVKNGLSKAQAVASAAGRGVDRIMKIEEQFSGGRPPMPMFREVAMAQAGGATPVAPGELEIRAQVSVTVAIK